MINIIYGVSIIIYILNSLSLTLYLSKYYWKKERLNMSLLYAVLTLISTYIYFVIAGYLLNLFLPKMLTILLSSTIYIFLTTFVYRLDLYSYKLSPTLVEMDEALKRSNEEINRLSNQIRIINQNFSYEREKKKDDK